MWYCTSGLFNVDNMQQCPCPAGVTVKAYLVDLETETIDTNPITVRAYLIQTVSEFKNLISQRTGLAAGQMRCVLERYSNELNLLSVPNKTLKAEGFVRSNKVFLECSGAEDDLTLPFNRTKFYKILDRFENTIRVHVGLPPFELGEVVSSAGASSSSVPVEPEAALPAASKPHDLDEGIGESESDTRHPPEESPSESATSDGPLKLGPHDNDAIHRHISDSIHRDLSTDHSESGNESAQSSRTSSQQTSPEENAKEFASGREFVSGENWDLDDDYGYPGGDEEFRRSFTASVHIDTETSARSLTVFVDKRISLGAFKLELEQYVGVPADKFRIYRVYGNNQEIETVRLNDTLSCFGDDSKMTVKFGRALQKGEHRVKVYQLQPNEPETCKFLLETIFWRGMNVLESKRQIVEELRKHCHMDVPLNRCRLRKKTCKSPGRIYLDNQTHEDQMMTSWEMFLEVLEEEEQMKSLSQLAIYVRQWRPSSYEIGPLVEVVLEKQTVKQLKEQISHKSGIPVEFIEIAKGRGTFPCEVGVLTAQTELDWNPDAASLNAGPLHVYEDGHIMYYRDSREELMELSEEKKKEIQQKENTRLPKLGGLYMYSPRKERALKIYTDHSPTTTSSKNPLAAAEEAPSTDTNSSSNYKWSSAISESFVELEI